MPDHGIMNRPDTQDDLPPDFSAAFRAALENEKLEQSRKTAAELSAIEIAGQMQALNDRLDAMQKRQEESDRKNQRLQIVSVVLVLLTLIATIVIGKITIGQNGGNCSTQSEFAVTSSAPMLS